MVYDNQKKITVSEAAFEDSQAAKHDGETWNGYVRRCGANPPRIEVLVPAAVIAECDPDEVEQWREAVRAEMRQTGDAEDREERIRAMDVGGSE